MSLIEGTVNNFEKEVIGFNYQISKFISKGYLIKT